MIKIVAVTACPTGIAHTYMAAESLELAAKKLKVSIKVETNGAMGVENGLSIKDILEADAVIIAADIKVETIRFMGKKVVIASTKDAIKSPIELIEKAINSKS